jgi:hypothetical protein
VLERARRELQLCLGQLRRLRDLAAGQRDELASKGLRALCDRILEELDDAYSAEIEHHLAVLSLREGVLVSARLGVASRGTGYVLRQAAGGRRGLKERLKMASQTAYRFEIAPRDDAGQRALGEVTDRAVSLAANALAQSVEHLRGFFSHLPAETAFSVGCVRLDAALRGAGVPVCVAQVEPHGSGALSASDLRDVGLVRRLGGAVVGNDLKADGATLVMVTGANSGGGRPSPAASARPSCSPSAGPRLRRRPS